MQDKRRLNTLLKIALALVAVNVLLCGCVIVYLTLLRPARAGESPLPWPLAGRNTATRTPAPPLKTPTATAPLPATYTPLPPTATRLAQQPTVPPTQPAVPPTSAATPAPPPAPAGAIVLNDPTLSQLLQAVANGQAGQAVFVNLSEGALDREIQASLTAGGAYQHQSARLQGGRLILTGRGSFEGISAEVQTTARLYAAGCRMTLDVERMRIGLLPAPRALVDQVQASARESLGGYAAAVGLCVEGVSVGDGALSIAGRVQR